jgi:hypothetical protein
MAAPPYVPTRPADRPRTYTSPEHVPESWKAERPGDLTGRQPRAPQLGYPGPDQGFGLVLANRLRDRLVLQPHEDADDVVTGCLGIGLRRASTFGRAPVVHDFTIAYTIWGFLVSEPPAELVALRRPRFEGLANTLHHYAELRELVDSIPEATIRRTHQQVKADYPARWKELLGV